jgi:hypothetical protein
MKNVMRTYQFVFALLAVAFMSNTALAQKEETILGSRGLRFSGIWGGPKTQITKFGTSNSYMNGGVLGLEFGNALYIGYGTNTLTSDVKWNDNTQTGDFKYQWSGPVVGYSFNSFKRAHPTLSVQAGQGNVWFNENTKDKIFVVQPTVGVELNVFRWFHVGLDGGYRFTSNTDPSISGLTDSQLSGAFGQLSLRFGYSWNRNGWRKKNRSSSNSDRSEKL